MLNRRDFLTVTAAAAASAIPGQVRAAPQPANAEWRNKQSNMTYRRLGRTGVTVQVPQSNFLDKSRRIVYCRVDECESRSPRKPTRGSSE